MANNELTVIASDGSTKVLRSDDVGSSVQMQLVKVAPAMPAVVAGAQYALSITTAAAVTLTVPATATHALVTVEDANVRFREDGVNPTTGAGGSGLLLTPGFIGELACPNALRFIGETGTAQLNVTYRRYV